MQLFVASQNIGQVFIEVTISDAVSERHLTNMDDDIRHCKHIGKGMTVNVSCIYSLNEIFAMLLVSIGNWITRMI
jgi:hypothetical protein